MKVLVMSDSHGSRSAVSKIVDSNPDVRLIIHLGDGEEDTEFVPVLNGHAELVAVKGNCDFASLLPAERIKYVEGHTIYCTHGHEQRVKQGTSALTAKAKKIGADIVLYGHTHTPVHKVVENIHLFNPGSVRGGMYGIMTIDGDKVVFEHKSVE